MGYSILYRVPLSIIMITTDLTEYDIKPIELINYLRYHGPHFSKRLCKFAVSLMTKEDDKGNELPIKPYTKDEVDELLERHNIILKYKPAYDHVFVANMCKADFLEESVPDEKHLAIFVKNYLGDIDGYDGMPFNRWMADMAKKGITINWEDMV